MRDSKRTKKKRRENRKKTTIHIADRISHTKWNETEPISIYLTADSNVNSCFSFSPFGLPLLYLAMRSVRSFFIILFRCPLSPSVCRLGYARRFEFQCIEKYSLNHSNIFCTSHITSVYVWCCCVRFFFACRVLHAVLELMRCCCFFIVIFSLFRNKTCKRHLFCIFRSHHQQTEPKEVSDTFHSFGLLVVRFSFTHRHSFHPISSKSTTYHSWHMQTRKHIGVFCAKSTATMNWIHPNGVWKRAGEFFTIFAIWFVSWYIQLKLKFRFIFSETVFPIWNVHHPTCDHNNNQSDVMK